MKTAYAHTYDNSKLNPQKEKSFLFFYYSIRNKEPKVEVIEAHMSRVQKSKISTSGWRRPCTYQKPNRLIINRSNPKELSNTKKYL